MEKPEDLVELGIFDDAVSAYIIKGVLSTNGIESVVTNELMSGILPLNTLSVGQVRLLVFRKQLEEARRVVERNSEENHLEE